MALMSTRAIAMPLEDSWDLLKVHKLSNKAIVIGAVSRESDEKQWKEKKKATCIDEMARKRENWL